MSRRLQDFVSLISCDKNQRPEAEMGSYVSWLRRRHTLMKNLETRVVLDIVRNSQYKTANRDDVIFQQGKQKDRDEPYRFFIILQGSASMFVNPYMQQRQTNRRASIAPEMAFFAPITPPNSISQPKSAASRRTTSSKKSKTFAAVSEHSGTDISDADSEVSFTSETRNDCAENINEDHPSSNGTSSTLENKGQSRINTTPFAKTTSRESDDRKTLSRSSRLSNKSKRTKLGNFIVKYEKGKYFGEEAILDDSMCYTSTVIADEHVEFMTLEEKYFNMFIKEQHERETTNLTNFVDIHPFFNRLSLYCQGVIQISLRPEHHLAGTFIVKQGEIVNKLLFIVSGSAEVMMEPEVHVHQYPDYWPFETSNDLYFNQFEWLRESRRRTYRQKYKQHKEAFHRLLKVKSRKSISVCAVQNKEVIGITEHVLDLQTHIQSFRCITDCEVYTLSLKPFNYHCEEKTYNIWKNEWGDEIFLSCYIRNSASVGINIHSKLSYDVKEYKTIIDGRMQLLK